jgi:gluconate 2-dehydrogenase gamma chain
MRRREFLTIPVGMFGGVLLHQLRRIPARARVEQGAVRVPLRYFTEAEARIVAAACERIVPRDANGPGATDAGVVIYIDRQLAGPYGRDKYRYTKPPFVESFPEHGYQGKASPREIYRAGIRGIAGFAELSAAEQDARLRTIEKNRFFQLLRAHTIEGMFCDPIHGGNTNLAGWQLIGYPGPRMSNAADIDAHYGRAFRPRPQGLAQITGRAIPVWEDDTE